MRTFTVKFDCENAAFQDSPEAEEAEIARILRAIADSVESGEEIMHDRPIHDINGNHIGRFKLVTSEI